MSCCVSSHANLDRRLPHEHHITTQLRSRVYWRSLVFIRGTHKVLGTVAEVLMCRRGASFRCDLKPRTTSMLASAVVGSTSSSLLVHAHRPGRAGRPESRWRTTDSSAGLRRNTTARLMSPRQCSGGYGVATKARPKPALPAAAEAWGSAAKAPGTPTARAACALGPIFAARRS